MAERRAELFFAYLQQALTLLSVETPLHFAAVRQRLGTRAVSIQIGNAEPSRLCLGHGPPWLTREVAADVEVSLSQADLDAFLRGQLTLEQGLEESRLAVRGKLDDVLSALEALQCWLHGALRSPSVPALHRLYLNGQDPSAFHALAQKGIP